MNFQRWKRMKSKNWYFVPKTIFMAKIIDATMESAVSMYNSCRFLQEVKWNISSNIFLHITRTTEELENVMCCNTESPTYKIPVQTSNRSLELAVTCSGRQNRRSFEPTPGLTIRTEGWRGASGNASCYQSSHAEPENWSEKSQINLLIQSRVSKI